MTVYLLTKRIKNIVNTSFAFYFCKFIKLFIVISYDGCFVFVLRNAGTNHLFIGIITSAAREPTVEQTFLPVLPH